MNTFVRHLALPVLSAGILGGAALGLSCVANAAEVAPAPSPALVAEPQIHAQPAPSAVPGYWWHRHHTTLLDPMTANEFPTIG